MVGYVYMTTNDINGKRYIGRKTSNKFLGEQYLGSGVHLQNAIKKYGKENFSVSLLQECSSYDELVQLEMLYIEEFNAVDSEEFYNMSYGGYQEGFIRGEENIAKSPRSRYLNSLKHKGKKMPEGFGEKVRQNKLGKPSGMLGHKHSEETKRIISESSTRTNLQRNPEIYQRISKVKIGNKMMNRDGICVRVHPKDFDSYLEDGYVFGGLKRRKHTKKKRGPQPNFHSTLGRKWIHKEDIKKLVCEDDLNSYLLDGWNLGLK